MRKIFYLLLPALFVCLVAYVPDPTKTITGCVKDEKGEAVAFATITEKGTQNRVKADVNGCFSIIIKEGSSIIVSAAGHEEKTLTPVTTSVTITLAIKSEAMSEVVVTTALGIKRRPKELGYTQATVSSTSLFGSSSRGYSGSGLQGKVAGVTVSSYSNKWTANAKPTISGENVQLLSKKQRRKFEKDFHDSIRNDFNSEGYDRLVENPFAEATRNPVSTFSIDVDAAAYSNVRRFINEGQLPPNGAIRTEEMINYFHYEYPQPKDHYPFSINTELSDCPWNAKHKLMMIGLQGKNVLTHNLPPSNLVFLVDVSGSMQDPMKLPLVQTSLKLLVDQLRPEDAVALVTYAGNAGLALPTTAGTEKEKIKAAIDNLNAGGSTAGGQGIQLAYKIARENFGQQQNNRVILCTDGDFNVGISSDDELVRLIEKERESGIYLTVLGFGMGNYQDAKMQKLADKGNGNHAYIDGLDEAKKVLVKEFGGTLFTIAKDVKLQIEFNPAKVQAYRLIGYENRLLAKEDFNDDKKDAGELGSGHTVTALYEIIPVGVQSSFIKKADDLKYQKNETKLSTAATGNEMVTIKFRYKEPEKEKSELLVQTVNEEAKIFTEASENLRFAASVAQFAMLLRKSEYKADADYEKVISVAKQATGKDAEGYRTEFVKLVEKAKALDKPKETAKLEKKEGVE